MILPKAKLNGFDEVKGVTLKKHFICVNILNFKVIKFTL